MRCALAVLVLSAWQVVARTDAPDPAIAADEQTLRASKIGSDGPSLLAFFRQRTLGQGEAAKFAGLVEQLGAASYSQREQAMAQLMKAGQIARPFLEQALRHRDEEVARRCTLLLRHLAQNPDSVQAAAAGRLLARLKPAGAAEVLLGYLPFVSDTLVAEEVRRALTAVAVRDGQPEPAVVAALTDKLSVKRAAAAMALAPVVDKVPAVRKLLRDPDPPVRLRAAVALALARQKDAVPVLIDLLPVLPAELSWQAEDLLNRLAGESAPATNPGKPDQTREAWTAWWKANEAKVDLARLTAAPAFLGFTLLTDGFAKGGIKGGVKGGNGQVFEVGPDRQVRWKIEGLGNPIDAEVVGTNRVLIAEYTGNAVTERDFQGNVLWRHQVVRPTGVQRLPNSETFIVTRNRLVVVDRAGKEVFYLDRGWDYYRSCPPAARGQTVVVDFRGMCLRLDAAGKEMSRFQVGQMYTIGASLDALPGGRVLVPQYRQNKVTEYAHDGKVVWEANVTLPTSAVRLPNGNTLAVSMGQRRAVELSPAGQEVWSYAFTGRPWRARRR